MQDTRRIGNGWLLPAGPLREPPSRLNTADLVITRQASPHQHRAPQALRPPNELSMWLQITGIYSLDNKINLSVEDFIELQKNKATMAIAAISEPDRFFKTLNDAAIQYQNSVGLPDHHSLGAAFFKAQQADLLLITAKDAVKCRGLHDSRIWVVATEAVFSDPLWATKLIKQLPRLARSQPD